MKKNNFPLMGKIVTVNAMYERIELYDGLEFPAKNYINSKIIERKWKIIEINPRAGWVTGYRYLQEGIYRPERTTSSRSYDADYEPPYLEISNIIRCLLVSFFPTYNPVKVPINSVWFPGGTPKSTQYKWTEQEKQQFSKESKLFPRDKYGRFSKC
jgi:hypothetical protein